MEGNPQVRSEPIERSAPGRHQGEPRAEFSRRWAIGGDRTCDHVPGETALLGLGGLYDYRRCRRCEAIVVASLLE